MENDEKKLEEEKLESKNIQENEYIPEQLDDEEFEKEKEDAKRLKMEKKLAKKNKKNKSKSIDSAENLEDGEGNVAKKSKKKLIAKIIIIIAVIAVVIGGIVGFFVITLNKPENVVKDFISYYNAQNWNEVVNCIDFKGLYALNTLEEAEYTKYDTHYSEIESDENYQAFTDFLADRLEIKDDILNEFMEDSKMTLGEIYGVEKIENTENLYKIRADITISVGGESQTQTLNLYVSKLDGKYKLVGGELPLLIEYAFELSVSYEF